MPMIAIAGNRSRRTKEMMPAPTPHTAEAAVATTIAQITAPLPVLWVAMTIANAMPPIGQSSEVKPNTGDALTRSGSLDAKRSSVAVPRLRDRAEVILFLSRGAPSVLLKSEHFGSGSACITEPSRVGVPGRPTARRSTISFLRSTRFPACVSQPTFRRVRDEG